jgi:Fe-Mn family superoxide dismutase
MKISEIHNLIETKENLKCLPLKYSESALEPVMSKHNVEVHFQILTKNYFKKYAKTGDLFQKAGAVLHNSYWQCLKPYDVKNTPTPKIMELLEKNYGSWKKFEDNWIEEAIKVHGSGWVMLNKSGKIITVQNHKIVPHILPTDLWEHATSDYSYNKENFLKDFWKIVDWDVVESRL